MGGRMILSHCLFSGYLFNDILYIGILLLPPVCYYCVFSRLWYKSSGLRSPNFLLFVAFPGGGHPGTLDPAGFLAVFGGSLEERRGRVMSVAFILRRVS